MYITLVCLSARPLGHHLGDRLSQILRLLWKQPGVRRQQE
jgi:hypothetical protein